MTSNLTESDLQDLAWAVVSRERLKPWGLKHRLDLATVREIAKTAEVVDMVATYGVRLRDRTTAWLESLSTPVVDQLAEVVAQIAQTKANPPKRRRSRLQAKRIRERRFAKRLAQLQHRLGQPGDQA